MCEGGALNSNSPPYFHSISLRAGHHRIHPLERHRTPCSSPARPRCAHPPETRHLARHCVIQPQLEDASKTEMEDSYSGGGPGDGSRQEVMPGHRRRRVGARFAASSHGLCVQFSARARALVAVDPPRESPRASHCVWFPTHALTHS